MLRTAIMGGGFNPLNVGGAGFCFRASMGIGLDAFNKVYQWADPRNNGIVVTYADPGRPGYSSTGMNGLPAVMFTTTSALEFNLDLALGASWTNWEVYVVLDCANTGMQCIFGTNQIPLYIINSRPQERVSPYLNWGSDTLGPRIIRFRWSTSDRGISVNGAAEVTDATGVAQGYCVKISRSDGFGLNGPLSELIGFPRYLTTNERLYLEKGYGTEYGIVTA